MFQKKKAWFLFLLFCLINAIILNLGKGKIVSLVGLKLTAAQAAGTDADLLTLSDFSDIPGVTQAYVDAYKLFAGTKAGDGAGYEKAASAFQEIAGSTTNPEIELRSLYMVTFCNFLQLKVSEAYQSGLKVLALSEKLCRGNPRAELMAKLVASINRGEISDVSKLQDIIKTNLPDDKVSGLIEDLSLLSEAGRRNEEHAQKMTQKESSGLKDSLTDLEKRARSLTALAQGAESWRKEVLNRLEPLKKRIKRGDSGYIRIETEYFEYTQIAAEISQLETILAGLEKGKVTDRDLLVYAVRPITSNRILPDAFHIPGSEISDTLSVLACPGEYEPAGFVLYPSADIDSLKLAATELKGEGESVIPSANVDIKAVKCWYQAGTAWLGIDQAKSSKVLVPELLLNDDSLVKVDYEKKENYVKLTYSKGTPSETEKYVWISNPAEKIANAVAIPNEEFPVYDSPSLLPVNIAAKTNKQFWVTVKVPDNAAPGTYTGRIMLSTPQKNLETITLKLRVLPFKLAAPRTNYDSAKEFIGSVYLLGGPIREEGTIGCWVRNEEQYTREMQDLFAHGVTNPFLSRLGGKFYDVNASTEEIVSKVLLEKSLKIRRAAGMKSPTLFLDGQIGNPTGAAELKSLQEVVKATIALVKTYGISEVYFYGIDEAQGDRLTSQRPAWQAVHDAGGKIMVSGYIGTFETMGDLLDLLVWAGPLSQEEAAKWHSRGHKILSYGNPQAGVENPEIYRRNYGLLLWQNNYDGAMDFAYHSGSGWNDFYDPSTRCLNFVYPTVNGIIDTIAWEGFREGMDDVRYATTLRQAIEKAKTDPEAQAAQKWLDGLDAGKGDLDAIRLKMINYILKLTGAEQAKEPS